MKKGLTLTLTAVVLALLGAKAMGMAPVALDLRDIIVGDAEDVSAANIFVYPDAIDLSRGVGFTDSDTADDANIAWSFFVAGGTYLMNGKSTLDLATDDPVAPGAKKINAAEDDPWTPAGTNVWQPGGEDGNAFTATVRNANLTPLTGSPTDPTGSGIIASETKTVTLFVSDGEATDSTTIMIYTDDDGWDSPSPAPVGPSWTQTATLNFSGGIPSGYNYASVAGSITSSVSGGMCMTAPATGNSMAVWQGKYGDIPYVENALYRVRLTVSSTASALDTNPLWDIVLENQAIGGAQGLFVYSGDWWFLDRDTGSNSAGVQRTEFTFYYTPAAVNIAAFKTAMAGNDAGNDMRMDFRVIDSDPAGYGANLDQGTLCIVSVDVDRMDMGDLQTTGVAWSDDDLQTSEYTVWALVSSSSFTKTFTSGDLTVRPSNTSTGWSAELVGIDPGTAPFALDAAHYPFVWEDNTVYMMEVVMAAPDANSETNPPDFFDFNLDTSNSELFSESILIANASKCAMTKQTPATYVAFLNGHSAPPSGTAANLKRVRGHMSLGAITAQVAGIVNNTGGVTVQSFAVKKVNVQ